MEFRHLKYFVAAAEELHFARAAERLGIAPPTLTVQIQELERSLHARLFVRVGRSVGLTVAGSLFLTEVRLVLAQLAQAESVALRAGRGELGRIAVGYVGSAAYAGVLQSQVAAFRAIAPDVMVAVSECPMGTVPKRLEEGDLDVAFVRLPMKIPDSLMTHTLLVDAFCVTLPAAHVLAEASGSLLPKALAGEIFVVPEQASGTYEVARRGRFTPHIGTTPGSLLSVLTQVSVGAGVAIVPGVLRNVVDMPGIRYKSLAGRPITSSVAAIFRRHELSATVRRFIETLRGTPPVVSS
jgi:DNA-binding transcriptional LysR family regulator